MASHHVFVPGSAEQPEKESVISNAKIVTSSFFTFIPPENSLFRDTLTDFIYAVNQQASAVVIVANYNLD